ncbi:uncharacterized protein SRS1_13078 [Sporisorium reilianum f. sp. reilianum]|uniref:Uncharacterized protein n=1 Tax=Sporisorium reilianum f. sp. reilianum TaxID=72559 RepID=A0A2N8UBV6_9BASI|nr:uncharacterized protein SRS1_13078 [Sporisorium reilianum f. sp. reilianum]
MCEDSPPGSDAPSPRRARSPDLDYDPRPSNRARHSDASTYYSRSVPSRQIQLRQILLDEHWSEVGCGTCIIDGFKCLPPTAGSPLEKCQRCSNENKSCDCRWILNKSHVKRMTGLLESETRLEYNAVFMEAERTVYGSNLGGAKDKRRDYPWAPASTRLTPRPASSRTSSTPNPASASTSSTPLPPAATSSSNSPAPASINPTTAVAARSRLVLNLTSPAPPPPSSTTDTGPSIATQQPVDDTRPESEALEEYHILTSGYNQTLSNWLSTIGRRASLEEQNRMFRQTHELILEASRRLGKVSIAFAPGPAIRIADFLPFLSLFAEEQSEH